jgi:hypothetical protein
MPGQLPRRGLVESGSRQVLGESHEYSRLRHAIEKGHGDRERAITFVCRLYHVRTLDALPGAIRAATLALLDASAVRGVD